MRVRDALPMRVTAGWGLPPDATPWEKPSGSQRGSEAAPIDVTVVPNPSQRPAAITTLIGGVGTATAMGIMMGAQHERGLPVATLSLVLAGGTVFLILLIGAFIATDRMRIQGDSELSIERRALGITWKRQTIARTALRHVWAVGPDPAEPHHLLLQLDSGPLALRCVGNEARALRSQLDA